VTVESFAPRPASPSRPALVNGRPRRTEPLRAAGRERPAVKSNGHANGNGKATAAKPAPERDRLGV
jgi:hypothetical protein